MNMQCSYEPAAGIGDQKLVDA
ncbi:MAG: hypothetical protein K0S28_1707, partial [Paucimonas sp.]|nr:hypothetical protein [Paucimonas sp.]